MSSSQQRVEVVKERDIMSHILGYAKIQRNGLNVEKGIKQRR